MPNERLTENIVRNLLRDKGYYDNNNIVVEEQSSKPGPKNVTTSKTNPKQKTGNLL